MKTKINIKNIVLAVFSVLLFTGVSLAQNKKPAKVRLKAAFVKVMGDEAYIDIKASARVNKKNISVSNIELIVSNVLEDETTILGKTSTNMNGESKFILKNFNSIKTDTTNTYNLVLNFKGNDEFKKAKKSISFKDGAINAKLITKDSINYISATLQDKVTGNPIVEESLTVQVQRLFRPLGIGEEFNFTDDHGSVLVPVEEGIPGVDGLLKIEVVLSESDDYGTIKAVVDAPIGKLIVDESTFDQRTMWSPRDKTPIFLLIFPNILIFGIWGLIIYLVINLNKLSKS